jgi:uncharacterized protein
VAARLNVRLQPRASSNQIVGWREGELAIRLTAPPVEGEANAALLDFIAKTLGVRKTDIRLLSGARSRCKVLEIASLEDDQLRARLADLGLEPDDAG